MTRPAVVIGLGGTGQWVVTYVKRDLQETYGDKIPDNVKLLVFDTEVLPAAKAASGSGGGKINIGGKEMDEQTYRSMFGNVSLNDTEYKHLGGNVQQFCEGIRDGQYPHIQRWFDAKWFIENQPQAIFTLRDGAAAWRQFGRLATFYDLRNLGGSILWSSIRTALDGISIRDMEKTGASRGIEVIIVSSIVGGTGAGMAIDIANLIREAAKSKPITLRGVFVLPQAFGISKERDDDATKKRARAFATWREMDRFRILGGATGGLPLEYTSNFKWVLDKPLFDAVYMVDGARHGGTAMNPQGRPELHVYPMLADFVNVLLDGKAGQEFSARALNLPSLDDNPQTPKYSAVGTYSLKSPVHYVMREQTTRFAQNFLREWLQLFEDPQRRGVYYMATNQNKEGGNYANRSGREAAVDFLATSDFRWVDPDGKVLQAQSTLFPTHIREVVTVAEQYKAELIDRMVQGAAVADLLNVFTDLRQTDTDALKDELQQAMAATLVGVAPSSRDLKEDPTDAPPRLESVIPRFILENFGGSDGTREETGKFGTALQRLQVQQLARFKQSLQVFLLKILMGDSTDAKAARSGKAGFVRDFLEGLLLAFNNYTTMLNTVEEKRQKAGMILTLAQDVQDARHRMLDHASDKWPIINSPKPAAYNTQEDYLRAVQAQIDGRKDDLFYRAVRQTTEAMRKFVRTTLDNFMQLHDTLIGNADVGVEGLYVELERNLDRVSAGRSRESRELGQIQRVYELAMDTKVRDEMLAIALNTIEWVVSPAPEGDSFTFNVNFRPFGETTNETQTQRTTLATKGNNRNAQNIQTLLGFSSKAYEPVWSQNRIAQLLMEEYQGQTEALARTLYNQAEPLYADSGKSDQGPKAYSQWVRLQRVGGQENDFFSQFEAQLRERDDRLAPVTRVIDSDDPFRMTLVRTDDLIPSVYFSEYDDSRRQYLELAQKYAGTFNPEIAGRLLHTFPAEANALALELEILGVTNEFTPLHPLVVAGLEENDRAMDFFFALLLGYIWEEEGPDGNYYALRLPFIRRDGTLDRNNYGSTFWLSKPAHTTKAEDNTAIFRAFANFVALGRDYREGSLATVNYNEVREVIRATVKEVGSSELRDRILQMLEGQGGLVDVLREQAYLIERTNPQRAYDAKARYDFARVLILMTLRATRNTYRIDLGLGTGGDYRTRITQLLQNR